MIYADEGKNRGRCKEIIQEPLRMKKVTADYADLGRLRKRKRRICLPSRASLKRADASFKRSHSYKEGKPPITPIKEKKGKKEIMSCRALNRILMRM